MTSRLLISNSGGRTSGYMTWRALKELSGKYDEIVVLFSNTGCEHEKTLEFVNNCDKYFNFNTVWLEAVINPEFGKGATHKIVNFETASRDGSPFEAAVKKYGIYNKASPNCTRVLKLDPMRSYTRDVLCWKRNSYDTAIGLRADEIDRISVVAEKNKVIYPLIKLKVTKTMILDWWASQDFDLGLEELYGNCVWCYKKSDTKLLTIAKDAPSYFDFPDKMERCYGTHINAYGNKYVNSKFFRGHRSAKDIIATSKEPFRRWTQKTEINQIGLFSMDEMDLPNGCSESCEVEYI